MILFFSEINSNETAAPKNMPPKKQPSKTLKTKPDADYVEDTPFGRVNLSQNARDLVDMLPDTHAMKMSQTKSNPVKKSNTKK